MENGRRSDFHSATKVELNVASQDLSAQEIIAAFSDGAVKLMMDTIPIRYGPRFSRLFAEHIRSLEARHAAAIAPGTNNWADAIYALHLRAGSLGPKKAAAMLSKV